MDMSLTWGSGRGSEPQSGIDKGIRAGCVVDTTSDNASTTQLKRPVSYVVDTPNRTADNGGSERSSRR